MNVLIRTDASTRLGGGHVIRCLTLADAFRAKGARVSFVCRSMPGDLCDVIAEAGHSIHRLPAVDGKAADDWRADAEQTVAACGNTSLDWVVVDHYSLDRQWERALRAVARNVMVIDDLADRNHDCDVLLDQNYYEDLHCRYTERVPASCTLLLGPKYALLRPDFASLRPKQPRDTSVVRRLLVFLGGGDPEGVTGRVLKVLDNIAPELDTDIVVGSSNQRISELTQYCASRPSRQLHVQTSKMAQLLMSADMAVGGGGATSWERACLGIPSLVIGHADNQYPIAEALARKGAHFYIGRAEDVDNSMLSNALNIMLANCYLRRFLSETSLAITDGRGVSRVMKHLYPPKIKLRAAVEDDCEKLFEWRNDPRTRRHAFNSSALDIATHRKWFKTTLLSPQNILLVGLADETEVGVIRYDLRGNEACISIYLDPAQHGRGHGTLLLTAGIEWLRAHLPSVQYIIANVRSENRISAQAFLVAGYRETHRSFRFDLYPADLAGQAS